MRHGKHLFLPLNSGFVLMLHFGMTGYLSAYKGRDDPEYAYLTVRFDDGYSLSYVIKRMLGAVALADSVEEYLRENDLGPDALDVSPDQLAQIVAGGRGAVKTTLMNQSRIAGLGNIYTDEILFHARIDPRRECDDLTSEDTKEIHRQIARVCDVAVRAHARPERMPDSFLITHRSPEDSCPRCGGSVAKVTLSGRSTYLCPQCQR
jgi:formamidopyrimidine-DNA glycosylase